jgi:hypothetical protein
MAIMMAIQPTILLNMRHVDLVSAKMPSHVQPHHLGIPMLPNAGLGFLVANISQARALALSSGAVAAALFGMAVVHSSKLLFALAYAAYSVLLCLKTLCTLIIAEYV